MIKDLKELASLLKLCRKNGVTEITVGETSIKLGELPNRTSQQESIEAEDDGLIDLGEAPLTAEELTFFANGGNPSENPYRA